MSIYGDHALDELQIRNRIARAGQTMVGYGSTGPAERQDAYRDWLFPNDEPRVADAMADQMYSCGLHGWRCLIAAGIDIPEAWEPYAKHIGQVIAWLESTARRMGAYVPLTKIEHVAEAAQSLLDFGDILVVDGPVHVIVLTERLANGDFVTSEGGSPEVGTHKDGTGQEKGMGIKSRVMRTRVVNGRLQTGTVNADGSVTWGRLALYAICAANLRRVE